MNLTKRKLDGAKYGERVRSTIASLKVSDSDRPCKHAHNPRQQKKRNRHMHLAFTLAEVLIVLGIIGLIADMTIPTLVGSYRKQVVETRLVKFYSSVNQAIKLSEADNGAKSDWEVRTDDTDNLDWYNKYLAKYLRTVKVEKNLEITTLPNSPINIYFTDGSLVIIGTTWIFYPRASDYQKMDYDGDVVYLDTKDSGKKWFTFRENEHGLEPYKIFWDGTEESLRNHNTWGCRKNLSGTTERAYCAALIQYHGWKIPKDYPVAF